MVTHHLMKFDHVFQDEKFLQASFHPIDVEMGHTSELPELLRQPVNLRPLQKFIREWCRYFFFYSNLLCISCLIDLREKCWSFYCVFENQVLMRELMEMLVDDLPVTAKFFELLAVKSRSYRQVWTGFPISYNGPKMHTFRQAPL